MSLSSYESTILGDSPSAYWELQETSGTTAADASGNGDTGTFSGTYTLGQTSPPMGGTSVYFNGGYLTTATSFSTPTVYSIELWFNSTDANAPLVFLTDGTANSYAVVGLDSSGHLKGSTMNVGESAWQDTTSTSVYNDGKWHHAVYTASASTSTASLYVDGSLVASSSGITVDNVRTCKWVLAENPTSSHGYKSNAKAYIAHFSAWNATALTSTQVSNHYNAATGSSGTQYTATVNDTVSAPSDNVLKSISYHATVSDTVSTPSDTLSKSTSSHLTDAVSAPSDSVTPQSGHAVTISDTVSTPSDSVGRSIYTTKSDSVSAPIDTLSKAVDLSHVDTVGSSDATSKALDTSTSDSLTAPSDSISTKVSKLYTASVNDTVASPSDSFGGKRVATNRTDTQSTSDSIGKSLIVHFADSLSTSDSTNNAIGRSVTISDSTTFNDSIYTGQGQSIAPVKITLTINTSLSNTHIVTTSLTDTRKVV